MSPDEPAERREVQISALEHYSYCPRQCALIHVEQTFDENLYTIRGRLAHERTDRGEPSASGGVRTVRGIPLWSDALGLRGRADLVEFREQGPYPVEYKVGPPRGHHAALQLCAQALCLEEMLGVPVPRGALFHQATRRRVELPFVPALRATTLAAVEAVRRLLDAPRLPPAPADRRCRRCSLSESCLPEATCGPLPAAAWDAALLEVDRP